MWYIQTIDNYSTIKKKTNDTCNQMNEFQNIMLCERGQTQICTYYMIPFM